MIFFRLVHWLVGYVIFRAQGGFPERFINLCSLDSIPVRDIRCEDSVLSGKTSVEGYKKMRSAAKRSGMRLKISKKCGLPFFLRAQRKRSGILIGIAVFLLVPSFLSNMIWIIDVEGNYEYTDEQILSAAQQAGLYIGMPGAKLNAENTEREMLTEMGGLSWIAVNLKGSRVVIEVRENMNIPKIEDDNSPCNIVAAKDGQIVTLEAYKGTAAVKSTSAVTKGDLIIAGLSENNDTSVRVMHAKGYVTAYTNSGKETKREAEASVRKYTDRQNRYTLYILGISIPLFKDKKIDGCEYYKSDWRLEISGTKLPVGFSRHQYLFYEDTDKTLSDEELSLSASFDFLSNQAESFRYARIIDEEISAEKNENSIIISGNYKLLENIGKEQPFEID